MYYCLILLIIAIGSYLLGSIPFALIFNKLVFKQDPRETGSKNIGALNTLRIGVKKRGKIIGALSFLTVFLLDASKGVLAIILTQKFLSLNLGAFCPFCLNTPPHVLALAIASFFSILGHNHSIYIKFQGGRGAATIFGITLYLNLEMAMLWLVSVLLFIIVGELLAGHKLNKKFIPDALNNQIIGRLLGEIAGLVAFYFLNLEIFIIVALPLLLILSAHKGRLFEQLKNIQNKTYLPG